MINHKFYKNLFQTISYFSVIMVFEFFLLIGFFTSLKYEHNNGWILLIISLSLILLYFLIGFYWIFQKVIINEQGIKIVLFSKIIKVCKWDEIDIIEEAYIMKNPAIKIKIMDGTEINLDKRKSIMDLLVKYKKGTN